MPLFERHPSRSPESPVLVVHLEGWIDAGLAAATALASLLEATPVEPVATFDGDALIDYRARRPVLRLVDGTMAELTFREPRASVGADRSGRDIVFLAGPEPDFRWKEFAREVVGLARDLGVRMVVGLGAFPAPVPHTRPVRLASTSPDPALAARVGFVPGTIEVPAGAEAVLELACRDAGIAAVGLWARVPHYVSALPFPVASAALVAGLASVAELDLDVTQLETAGDLAMRRVDQLIANSDEHQAMVAELERSVDAAEGNTLQVGEIPSGDQLAAELERFLRGES